MRESHFADLNRSKDMTRFLLRELHFLRECCAANTTNLPKTRDPIVSAPPGVVLKGLPYFLSAIEPIAGPPRLLGVPALFRPTRRDETIGRPDETIFGLLGTFAKNSGNRRFVSRHHKTRATNAR
jgi:hypothetical protein